MRNAHILAPVGLLSLIAIQGCGGKPSVAEQPMNRNILAISSFEAVTRTDLDALRRTAGLQAGAPQDAQVRLFDDLLRFHLQARAAEDAGLTKDSAKVRRLESIRKRVLFNFYRQNIVVEQFGLTDAECDQWLAAHRDSATLATADRDSLRRAAARAIVLERTNLDSVRQANAASFRRDSVLPPLDSIRPQVENFVLGQVGDKLQQGMVDDLRARYKVELVSTEAVIPEDSLRAYWKSHPENWSSLPVFVVSALESKDSAALSKALARAKTREAFEALSAKFPIGSPKAPRGVLGRVKLNHALPYGVGMAPELFAAVDTGKLPLKTAALRAGQGIFRAYWVSERQDGVIKPYEQVAAQVRSRYLDEHPYKPAPTAVIARWDRGPLFTETDRAFITEEIPAQMRLRFPPERVLEFMIAWEVAARAAQESGLLARPSIQAEMLENERIYWAQLWRETPEAQAFLTTDSARNAAWSRWGQIVLPQGRPEVVGSINRDAARLAIMPEGYLRMAWAIQPDLYMRDSVVRPFDSAAPDVYRNVRPQLDQLGQKYLDSALRARYKVTLTAFAPQAPRFGSWQETFDTARALADRREYEAAERLYNDLESQAGQPDSVKAKALFRLGELASEQQRYTQAVEQYRKLLYLYPKSPDAYKAQFMIAFTYSEYLKEEKKSLAEYRKVITNYPGSDLSDDADWMIRNIESGGQLMPKFDDLPADSTLDSTKADTAKAPAAGAPQGSRAATSAAAATPPAPAAEKAAAPASGSAPAASATTSAKSAAPASSKAPSAAAAAPAKPADGAKAAPAEIRK